MPSSQYFGPPWYKILYLIKTTELWNNSNMDIYTWKMNKFKFSEYLLNLQIFTSCIKSAPVLSHCLWRKLFFFFFFFFFWEGHISWSVQPDFLFRTMHTKTEKTSEMWPDVTIRNPCNPWQCLSLSAMYLNTIFCH